MECGVSPAPDVSRIESSAGQKSPGSTPPSSVKDGAASQPRPISKAGIGQHQIRTPRGASLLSTNSGRGGLARQISSRGGLSLATICHHAHGLTPLPPALPFPRSWEGTPNPLPLEAADRRQ
ncbi:unnamed protein product [Symbiodinium sp. KB8]|nr:unnamed protein product [Symbiodinium sp. KB8]